MALLLSTLSKEFGTLVLIIKKMTADVRNFGILWVLFLCGFVLAEWYIARGIKDSLTDTALAFFTLSAGGDPDFSAWYVFNCSLINIGSDPIGPNIYI